MEEAKNISIDYQERCNQLKEEIIQSIKDGALQGIELGIENGLLEGIKESADMGFTNITETLTADSYQFINAMVDEVVEQEVENRIKERICPLLKNRLDKNCQKLLEKVKNEKNWKSSLINIEQELKLDDLIQEQLDQCIQTLNQFLPQNFIFIRIFNGCERALTTCLMENVAECEQLVQSKIQNHQKTLDDVIG